MSNYPDDIHQYDAHPSSPFYDPPCCDECGEELEDDNCLECEAEDEEKIAMLSRMPWVNRIAGADEPHKCTYEEFVIQRKKYIFLGNDESTANDKAIEYYAAKRISLSGVK